MVHYAYIVHQFGGGARVIFKATTQQHEMRRKTAYKKLAICDYWHRTTRQLVGSVNQQKQLPLSVPLPPSTPASSQFSYFHVVSLLGLSWKISRWFFVTATFVRNRDEFLKPGSHAVSPLTPWLAWKIYELWKSKLKIESNFTRNFLTDWH